MKKSAFIILIATILLTGCAGPLTKAVMENNIGEAKRLIDEGADVNKVDAATMMQPLVFAVIYDYDEMAELFVDKGAKTTDLLCIAISRGSISTAKMMVKKGVEVPEKCLHISGGGFVFNTIPIAEYASKTEHMDVYNAILDAKREKDKLDNDAIKDKLIQEKNKEMSEKAAALNILISKNDITASRALLDRNPEVLSYINDERVKLLFTGPAELRIIDINELIKQKKKNTIIMAYINNSGGPYKIFTINDINTLEKMGFTDEMMTAMMTVTTEYNNLHKRDLKK